jgi:predicted nucleic acid-binding protein
MEWLAALRGSVVALDTAPLIYFIEANPAYLPFVRPFFEAVDRGEFQLVTSVVTLAEVLVHPMRHGDHDLADHYRRILLHANHVTTLPVWGSIAEDAARLRARHGMRTPDAIQMATALSAGASSFLTNDSRFPSLASLKMIVLMNLTRKN